MILDLAFIRARIDEHPTSGRTRHDHDLLESLYADLVASQSALAVALEGRDKLDAAFSAHPELYDDLPELTEEQREDSRRKLAIAVCLRRAGIADSYRSQVVHLEATEAGLVLRPTPADLVAGPAVLVCR